MRKPHQASSLGLPLLLCFFLAFQSIPLLGANSYLATNSYLGMPEYGTYLGFASNVTMGSETYRQGGGTWNFANLNFNGITSDVSMLFTTPSPVGAVMILQSVDLNNWLNYTVSATGTQTFNDTPVPTLILIDGVAEPIGSGWIYYDGTLSISGALANVDISFSNFSLSPTEQPTPMASPTVEPTTNPTPTQNPSASPPPSNSPKPTSPILTPKPSPSAPYLNPIAIITTVVIAVIAALTVFVLAKKKLRAKLPSK